MLEGLCAVDAHARTKSPSGAREEPCVPGSRGSVHPPRGRYAGRGRANALRVCVSVSHDWREASTSCVLRGGIPFDAVPRLHTPMCTGG